MGLYEMHRAYYEGVVDAATFLDRLDLESGHGHTVWGYAFETKEAANAEIEFLEEIAQHVGRDNVSFMAVSGDEQRPAAPDKWVVLVLPG